MKSRISLRLPVRTTSVMGPTFLQTPVRSRTVPAPTRRGKHLFGTGVSPTPLDGERPFVVGSKRAFVLRLRSWVSGRGSADVPGAATARALAVGRRALPPARRPAPGHRAPDSGTRGHRPPATRGPACGPVAPATGRQRCPVVDPRRVCPCRAGRGRPARELSPKYPRAGSGPERPRHPRGARGPRGATRRHALAGRPPDAAHGGRASPSGPVGQGPSRAAPAGG